MGVESATCAVIGHTGPAGTVCGWCGREVEDSRGAWQRRYDQHSRQIEAHPQFRRLVQAVAAAEAPAAPARFRWDRSPAYWLTRGSTAPTARDVHARAQRLAERIATEVRPADVAGGWQRSDWVARVYVQARTWVSARRDPGR